MTLKNILLVLLTIPMAVVGWSQDFANARSAAPVESGRIDKLGRLMVNGKPFMPIGFYTYQITRKDIEILGDSPFNCIMSYDSCFLNVNHRDGLVQGITETLDALYAKKIKVIFSLKDFYNIPNLDYYYRAKEWNGVVGDDAMVKEIVTKFKDHPAMLAWYIGDEIESSRRQLMEDRRKLVHATDPDHPTWAVHCHAGEFRKFADCQDVFGIDPYPIRDEKSTDIKEVHTMMTEARKVTDATGNQALWVVPQAFNWGQYNKDAKQDIKLFLGKFRYPTEQEMLAICVLEAIDGAKGFIFFNYSDLSRGPDPDQFKKRWPELCRIGNELKDLSDFLLSDHPAPPMELKVEEGEVYARVFCNTQGAWRILIAATGPGPARAVISLPKHPALQSVTGKTELTTTGKYVFSGENIACDILK